MQEADPVEMPVIQPFCLEEEELPAAPPTSSPQPDQSGSTEAGAPSQGQSESTEAAAPSESQSECTVPAAQSHSQSESTVPAARIESQSESTDPAALSESQSESTVPAARIESQSESTVPAAQIESQSEPCRNLIEPETKEESHHKTQEVRGHAKIKTHTSHNSTFLLFSRYLYLFLPFVWQPMSSLHFSCLSSVSPPGSPRSDAAPSGEDAHRPEQHPRADPHQQQVLLQLSGTHTLPLADAFIQRDSQ